MTTETPPPPSNKKGVVPSNKKGAVKLKNEMEQLRGSYFNKI